MVKNDGEITIICKTNFVIEKKAEVKVDSLIKNDKNGQFTIILKTNTPELVSKIEVPVWRDDNQNDLFWYEASKIDQNTYQIVFDIANHNHHVGNYTIDIYAVLINDIKHYVNRSYQYISVSNYMYVERMGLGKYTVNVINPNNGNFQQVKIPVWSEANGQDDLVWYNASYVGNEVWSATVTTINHKDAGIYSAHVYVLIDDKDLFITKCNFNVLQSDMLTGMDLKAQNYRSDTDKLILVDLTNHRVGIYSGGYQNWVNIQSYVCTVGAPSTPTITGEFSIYMKRKYFDSGSSRCFYFSPFKGGYGFHSVLYYQDPTPQRIMDGRLGMDLSHGCVRLDVNHAKWIYDNCSIGTKVVVYR